MKAMNRMTTKYWYQYTTPALTTGIYGCPWFDTIMCVWNRWRRWRSAVVTSFASAPWARPLQWQTCASSLRTDLGWIFVWTMTIEDMNINVVGEGARPSSFRESPNRSVHSQPSVAHSSQRLPYRYYTGVPGGLVGYTTVNFVGSIITECIYNTRT